MIDFLVRMRFRLFDLIMAVPQCMGNNWWIVTRLKGKLISRFCLNKEKVTTCTTLDFVSK